MMSFFNKPNPNISFSHVSLGREIIDIPIAQLQGNEIGKTLLVTAGNDGDEYAGIEACYRLIEEYSHTIFSGSLIVIPIVNIPGFEQEMSKNPLDGKYPKHVYPGDPNGTSTDRIRHWLSTYVHTSDMWIDLHGGALTERVNPYIHAWKTGYQSIDVPIEQFLHTAKTPIAVFQDSPDAVLKPTEDDCGYLMCESGSFGQHSELAIEQHIDWVHTLLVSMHMIEGDVNVHPKKIVSHVQEYPVKHMGIWYSQIVQGLYIKQDDVLGTVRSLDGKLLETIRSKQSGVLLWEKQGLHVSKGDSVVGIGY